MGEPFKLTNYTQIFRSVVGPFTGTALKMGQKYDSKPLYRKAAKDGALRHMELMEKAGVIVTPGASFGPHGEGYVRFALVLPPEKIREVVEAIRKSGI